MVSLVPESKDWLKRACEMPDVRLIRRPIGHFATLVG